MRRLKVAVCYDPPAKGAGADLQDILTQVNYVTSLLLQNNYSVVKIPYKGVPEATSNEIIRSEPDILWNLFETFNGNESDQHMGAVLLDTLSIPYTGCSAQSFLFCADKTVVKSILKYVGVNVPATYGVEEGFIPGKWILKPKSLHGSVGIDDMSVVDAIIEDQLVNAILAKPLEHNIFAEQYIEGREFSVTMIDKGNGISSIAVAEMQFIDYADSKPKILNYDSKWAEDSTDYTKTVRTFDLSLIDIPLVTKLKKVANDIAPVLDLKGFARIDFRVDKNNTPWVIDVNPNPGLGEDTGFIAACNHAGISSREAINYIARAALL